MGYLSINNLYKDTDILLFKECYALEKIHGSSSHIVWSPEHGIGFMSGGEIIEYKKAIQYIGKKTAELYKKRISKYE